VSHAGLVGQPGHLSVHYVEVHFQLLERGGRAVVTVSLSNLHFNRLGDVTDIHLTKSPCVNKSDHNKDTETDEREVKRQRCRGHNFRKDPRCERTAGDAGSYVQSPKSDRVLVHLTENPLHPGKEQNAKEEETNESELHQVAQVDSRDIHLLYPRLD